MVVQKIDGCPVRLLWLSGQIIENLHVDNSKTAFEDTFLITLAVDGCPRECQSKRVSRREAIAVAPQVGDLGTINRVSVFKIRI